MVRLLTSLGLVLSSLSLPVLAQTPQNNLTQITNWGGNPSGLELRVYVPNKLKNKPALLLALHWCGSSGPEYFSSTKYAALADKKGFVVLFPSSPKDNNCWDVATTQSLTHNGGGDSTGLSNMVNWAIGTYGIDASRVYVVGTSSGCMMTNVMCATYPELFEAASCYSGVPAGCLAGSPGSSPTTADPFCASGANIKTGAQWAQIVHNMYPGYTGSYPRFQTFHGEADTFVNYPNFGEQLKQWSTVLGVEWKRNKTDTPETGYTEMIYGNGKELVGYSARGVGHFVPNHEDVDMKWFGI
ncbi:Alpha/Beta hydrolase protein [Echria macrotheca]|uniref:Carboxylic ester hydrolase n=1 Tax=Echria macrotheca TaxID=438768 RepID=A0AAJ0FBM9_9PEZI|nr:Alpha/Beta hydrolase protein [Echria macrotheca]